jgi:hypothetical protein
MNLHQCVNPSFHDDLLLPVKMTEKRAHEFLDPPHWFVTHTITHYSLRHNESAGMR